jgi:hypothetical protein
MIFKSEREKMPETIMHLRVTQYEIVLEAVSYAG